MKQTHGKTQVMSSQWLEWTRTLQAISQIGLHYAQDPFDLDRYRQVLDIAIRMLAANTDMAPETIRGMFDTQTGYATPKIDVRGAVFRNNRLLMVREKLDEGRWSLPGGWVDVNDAPHDAVEREILEETGYRARATKLLGVYDRNQHGHPPYLFHTYKLFFMCELLQDMPGEVSHTHETYGTQFLSEADIPLQDLSTVRVTAWEINRAFEHYHQPGLPTDFD